MRKAISLVMLLALIAGCNEATTKAAKKMVPMDSVPPIVLKAAQEREPNVKFDAVVKADGFYEVRGKDQTGKIVEVEVDETGKVLAVE